VLIHRQSVFTWSALLAASVTCMIGLTSCYPGHGGISLSAEEGALPRCKDIASVTVQEIEDPDRFDDCEPLDVPIVFPDGYALSIDENAGSAGAVPGTKNEPLSEYAIYRLGVYGVVATFTVPGNKVRRWGTPIGICLVRGMEDEQRNMTSGDCR
jgi:hypothetical protein